MATQRLRESQLFRLADCGHAIDLIVTDGKRLCHATNKAHDRLFRDGLALINDSVARKTIPGLLFAS